MPRYSASSAALAAAPVPARQQGRVDARLDIGDEVEFPGPALDLPDAESRQHNSATAQRPSRESRGEDERGVPPGASHPSVSAGVTASGLMS